MQSKSFVKDEYKPIDNIASNIGTSFLERLTRLRVDYERVRPRLIFLAENNPDSKEYKDLYMYCQGLFRESDLLIDMMD